MTKKYSVKELLAMSDEDFHLHIEEADEEELEGNPEKAKLLVRRTMEIVTRKLN